MGTIAGTLTRQEIQQAIQQAQQIAASVSPAVQSGQFVFFAAFDGTNNDRNHTGWLSRDNAVLILDRNHGWLSLLANAGRWGLAA